MNEVQFKRWRCVVQKNNYENGRMALCLMGAPGEEYQGEPIAVATVNIPEKTLDEGHVFIKEWSENEGMLAALIRSGWIAPPTWSIKTGHALAYVCKLLK